MRYKSQLTGKTFMFFIGHYRNLGGAEAAAIILAKALQERYAGKIIFVSGSKEGKVKDQLEQMGFQALYFSFNYKASFYKKLPRYFALIRFIRRQSPDYLLPYVAGNNKMVLPIWRYTGASYAWWMQQDEGRGLYKTQFERRMLEQASDIISNSEVGMDFFQRHKE